MRLFIVLSSLLVIETSQALKCWRCKDAKCNDLESETCAIDANTKEAACLTHVYKGSNKTEITEKKCVNVDRGGGKFECDNAGGEGIKCEICTDNLCNSGLTRHLSALMVTSFSCFVIYRYFSELALVKF